MATRTSMKTRVSGLALVATLSLAIVSVGKLLARTSTPAASPLRSADVIARHFPGKTSSFMARDGALRAGLEPSLGERTTDAVTVAAPLHASGSIEVSARGRATGARLSVVGATEAPATESPSGLLYQGGLAGVDIALLRDPDWMELLFVVHEPRLAPALTMKVALRGGPATIHTEPLTKAVLLSNQGGQTIARLDAPLAIDADGQQRRGTYLVHGDELTIQLPLDGLRAPVVIDPTVTLPTWSITSSALSPGGTMYSVERLARETSVTFDSARDRMVLVRPVRTQQPEDAFMLLGGALTDPDGAVQSIASRLRTGGAFTPSDDAVTSWQQGYYLENETWEFDGTTWQQSSARLPGRLGASLAFDPLHGKTLLFGGAAPNFACQFQSAFVSETTAIGCTNERTDETALYEYDGAQWVARRIAGAPSPRLRPAMVWDQRLKQMVLFGGRELRANGIGLVDINPHGVPFPENLTAGLLNDTWLFDGATWSRVTTGQPPPASEGAQLIHDPVRGVTFLVGGHTQDQNAAHSDELSLWEFDGLGWLDRLAPIAATLPPDLSTRRGASAFWNPSRQRVTLFGGFVRKLARCPTQSDAEIAAQVALTANDPAGRESLAATGCLGGYVHDFWEWTGTSFEQLADVVYGGMVDGVAVFRQAQAPAWGSGTVPTSPLTPPVAHTPLWPWRHATHDEVFPLRTSLEKTFRKDPPPEPTPAPSVPVPAGASPAVSPLFVSGLRPDLFVRADGNATLVPAGADRVYQTNGAAWSEATVSTSPFSAGRIDFFAATWDTAREQIVLFEPSRAETWVYSPGAGWSQKTAPGSPPPWSLGPRLRTLHDAQQDPGQFESRLGQIGQAMPILSFDAAHGRSLMLYGDQFWQWDGASWQSLPSPPDWTNCQSASGLAYDETRARTVLFGCSVPSRTLEWDGTAWSASLPGPHRGLVSRDDGDIAKDAYTQQFSYLTTWQGSLQLPFLHPNHTTYSSLLGGVVTLDADGSLRRWDGTSWQSEATLPSGHFCLISETDSAVRKNFRYPFPVNPQALLGRESLPLCFFPPLVEDAVHGRLLAFRDGPRGAMEMVAGETSGSWAWRPATLGRTIYLSADGTQSGGLSYPFISGYPYPFELMAPELTRATSLTDPASRQYPPYPPGATPPQLPEQSWRVAERRIDNLWWAFRLLRHPQTHEVTLITHRGLMWQLGGETLQGLGEPCTSSAQCGVGSCTAEGVCCDVSTCGDEMCTTCKGAHPGTCEVVAAGQPEPNGRCGSGECAGVCAGFSGYGSCQFDANRACGTAPSCSTQQFTPGGHCSPKGPACIQPNANWPTCPVVNGQPDLTALVNGYPCSPATSSCPAGLGCENATACKTACTSRLDCISRYETCNATSTGCTPDQASSVASSRGIVPVDWSPPRRKTNQELVVALKSAGYIPDEQGRFMFGRSFMDLTMGFDPSKIDPLTGAISCSQKILLCAQQFHSFDRCVSASVRCSGETPWQGDPQGQDCCPESCLVEYFSRRDNHSEAESMRSFTDGSCYPGLASYLQGQE